MEHRMTLAEVLQAALELAEGTGGIAYIEKTPFWALSKDHVLAHFAVFSDGEILPLSGYGIKLKSKQYVEPPTLRRAPRPKRNSHRNRLQRDLGKAA